MIDYKTIFRNAVLNQGANIKDIMRIERQWGRSLPLDYVNFLKFSDGLQEMESGLVLYGTEDIVDRNNTINSDVFRMDYLAIGDDSGGRMLLMSDVGDIFVVDMGGVDIPAESSLSWSDLPMLNDVMVFTNCFDDGMCSIYLNNIVTKSDLLLIKSSFGLTSGIVDLYKASKNKNIAIVNDYPVHKAMVIKRKLGRLGDSILID